jgi:uncharacterized repeat protein (TIGR03803 family)
MQIIRNLLLFLIFLTLRLGTIPVQAQTYTVLYSFTGGADGASPAGRLVRDAKGDLYGTSYRGGDPNCEAPYGCGVAFKLDIKGKLSILHSFIGPEGAEPRGSMLLVAGNLYGTARFGGGPCWCGTIYKLDAKKNLTVLYTFTGAPDGDTPLALVRDSKTKTLYGSTWVGGLHSRSCGGAGCGTIFSLSASGTYTPLYDFSGGSDGSSPTDLIRDSAGNLYGVGNGGLNGTVFKLDSTRHLTTLYSFTGGRDGGGSGYGLNEHYYKLARDTAGNLYGTTSGGGDPSCSCGVIFKLSKPGSETVLHSFLGGAEGAYPYESVIRDAAGNLYGITQFGGDMSCGNGSGCGTVFKLDPSGKLTTLHAFTNAEIGTGSVADGLIQDSAGKLYGVTEGGGAYGYGTIFEITP